MRVLRHIRKIISCDTYIYKGYFAVQEFLYFFTRWFRQVSPYIFAFTLRTYPREVHLQAKRFNHDNRVLLALLFVMLVMEFVNIENFFALILEANTAKIKKKSSFRFILNKIQLVYLIIIVNRLNV